MLKHINQISLRSKSKHIITIISSLNAIYNEINEYNTNYWSKYLLSIWLLHGSVVTIVLYYIAIVPMITVTKYIFIYAEFILMLTFLLIINTASSVNYEVNKSIKLLNSVMARDVRNRIYYKKLHKRKFQNYLSLRNIKVNVKNNSLCYK